MKTDLDSHVDSRLVVAVQARLESLPKIVTLAELQTLLGEQLDFMHELPGRPAAWLLLRTRLIEIAALALRGADCLGLETALAAAAKDEILKDGGRR
jgi:hypothetical protein